MRHASRPKTPGLKKPAPKTPAPRKIGILALPGVQMLDVAGPLDVFAEANLQSGRNAYAPCVISTIKGPIVSSSGLRIVPDMVLGTKTLSAFDTVLVAGAPHLGETPPDPRLLDWLRRHAPKSRRFGSVCSGAMLLAATGLLDRRRITTHWAVAEQLGRLFPNVQIEIDALHVRDHKIRTAAGVTAGLDLALALVEEDLGREIAKKVASQLLMFFKRPGGQLQFSRRGEANPVGRSALQEIQRWVAAHPAEDASLAALAGRAGLSRRHFARLFRKETGMTPADFVETVRIGVPPCLPASGRRHARGISATLRIGGRRVILSLLLR
jgi:transcriptional regulator GlxA family with amidase domain